MVLGVVIINILLFFWIILEFKKQLKAKTKKIDILVTNKIDVCNSLIRVILFIIYFFLYLRVLGIYLNKHSSIDFSCYLLRINERASTSKEFFFQYLLLLWFLPWLL